MTEAEGSARADEVDGEFLFAGAKRPSQAPRVIDQSVERLLGALKLRPEDISAVGPSPSAVEGLHTPDHRHFDGGRSA